jgi:hypothetical protein
MATPVTPYVWIPGLVWWPAVLQTIVIGLWLRQSIIIIISRDRFSCGFFSAAVSLCRSCIFKDFSNVPNLKQVNILKQVESDNALYKEIHSCPVISA